MLAIIRDKHFLASLVLAVGICLYMKDLPIFGLGCFFVGALILLRRERP